jgi:hypothetical protein
MTFEQRDMSGVLFKNTDKKTEKHPDYQGEAYVNGTQYRLAAWIKTGKKGKFMSLAFSIPRESKAEAAKPRDEDMIPF